MILGDEDDLAEALRAYADLGVDQVNLRIAPSGLPWDLARSTLDRVCDSGLVAEGAGGEAS